MILITGASGNVGGTVLQKILQHRSDVKAMYRSPADARNSPPKARAVIADFADRDSLRRAFEGVERLFLVCSPIPQLVELEGNAIAVAKEQGVKHIVYSSAGGAGTWEKSFPKWHTEVERVLQSSGVGYSILRPNTFMQNIVAFFAPTIQSQDAFYSSVGNSRASLVDVADIADVAAALLSGNAPDKVYELNGPEALTYAEVAERISRVCGRTVRYVDLPMAEQKKALLAMGMPEWQAQALLDLQEYYVEGNGGELTDDIQQITGHAPRNLNAFLVANAGAFTRRVATA
ncbi:MAG: SDR family oxidoreductase [Acidobacteria bacterium]|nr:SDR family oxidoreductase [Acidobacteriota bacterium]MBV9144465.1 SDR family oxidoreductase [Acidobacteriota bacterium]MBV9436895.1 SDR family oxidoreductase [Acidobacteriota bacterium]